MKSSKSRRMATTPIPIAKLQKLIKICNIVLKVNRAYIDSAGMDDSELATLIDDYYENAI